MPKDKKRNLSSEQIQYHQLNQDDHHQEILPKTSSQKHEKKIKINPKQDNDRKLSINDTTHDETKKINSSSASSSQLTATTTKVDSFAFSFTSDSSVPSSSEKQNVDSSSLLTSSSNFLTSNLFQPNTKISGNQSGFFKLSETFKDLEQDEEEMEDESEEETPEPELMERRADTEESTVKLVRDKSALQSLRFVKDPSTLPSQGFDPCAKYSKKHSFLFPLLPLQTAQVIVEKEVHKLSIESSKLAQNTNDSSLYKQMLNDLSVHSVIQNNLRDFGMYGQNFFRKNNPEAIKKIAHEKVSITRANKLRMLIQSIEGRHKRSVKKQ
ncbi:hypothetical protein FDP41_008873 [Naegleria fowleri]|uniref:Uncharacterized protein n=1 Tax=Naegleria fowleri TaxID=5763 RepID=A0A6A5BF34_NAEFO|nr:uncharacterized protein FDP41_008873 [Naegleria fowleri]KAF0972624.1 hypothetical protein FDP41_008873 [Naegleria fowleri]